MSLVEEIRSRRGGDTDPAFDQDKARAEFSRAAKRRGRADASQMTEIYNEGVREGQRKSAGRRKAQPSRPRRSSASRGRTTPARRRQSPARAVIAPVRDQLASGTRVIGLSLLVVALYLALESAPAITALFGGSDPTKPTGLLAGLQWLRSPTATIPRNGG